MAKIREVHTYVFEALTNKPKTRGDDFLLILEVMQHYVLTSLMTVDDLFKSHELYKMPSIETITRARRKIQADHPELCNVKVKAIRDEETEAYKNYATNK